MKTPTTRAFAFMLASVPDSPDEVFVLARLAHVSPVIQVFPGILVNRQRHPLGTVKIGKRLLCISRRI